VPATTTARGRDVRGILLLDKPRGITSNRALQRVKRLYGAAKAGHTGSLDPLATGMLPICLGAATRLGTFLLDAHKVYRVTARLGIATDTGDADGAITERRDAPRPSEPELRAALARFEGDIEQTPPMYSALKHDGVRLYKLARRGTVVARAPRRVSIRELKLERYAWPDAELLVRCSKGTYVRSLVVDIAAALGTIAHVAELRRLAVEPFDGEPMTTIEELESLAGSGGTSALDARLLPPERALPGWPEVLLSRDAAERLARGQAVAADPAWPQGRVMVYREPRELVAIGEVTPERRLAPRRVFAR
jgi:tRNA pseudouridine55 synthase